MRAPNGKNLSDLNRTPFYGLRFAIIGVLVLAVVIYLLDYVVFPQVSRTPVHAQFAQAAVVPLPRVVVPTVRETNTLQRNFVAVETHPIAHVKEPAGPKPPPPSPASTATSSIAPAESTGSTGSGSSSGTLPESFKIHAALYLLISILVIATLVSLVSFFTYLFHRDSVVADRAGGVFKTAFAFLVTVGTGAATYLKFSGKA